MAETDSGVGTTERGRRTAARLRGAAREVFAEHGFLNARVADIVDRISVSHGTFYTYYANKAAILEALVHEVSARLEEVVTRPWEGADARSVLERVIGEFLDISAEEVAVLGAWIEAAAVEERFAVLLQETREGFVRRVAANVEPLAARDGHDPLTVARALVAMVEGFVAGHPGVLSGDRSEHVRTLATLWHGGLRSLGRAANSADRA